MTNAKARLAERTHDVALHYPHLHLYVVEVPNEPSTRARHDLKERLGRLAERIGGPQVLRQHEQEVPHAFRKLYLQMGLDPGVQPTPIDAVLQERIAYGMFRSMGLVDDALKVALLETGVPVWAADSAKLAGDLALQMPDVDPEGGRPSAVPFIADGRGTIAPVGGAPKEPHAVGRKTKDLTLFALQCDGISTMHVQEALWLAQSLVHHQ